MHRAGNALIKVCTKRGIPVPHPYLVLAALSGSWWSFSKLVDSGCGGEQADGLIVVGRRSMSR